VRRKAQAWSDDSTPNTGLVVLTERSSVPGAAACVAADFLDNVSAGSLAQEGPSARAGAPPHRRATHRVQQCADGLMLCVCVCVCVFVCRRCPQELTRVVVATPDEAAKGLRTLRLAARMIGSSSGSGSTQPAEQQQGATHQQQRASGDTPAAERTVLVFQPGMVRTRLGAPARGGVCARAVSVLLCEPCCRGPVRVSPQSHAATRHTVRPLLHCTTTDHGRPSSAAPPA
jgi:hypothetical protein